MNNKLFICSYKLILLFTFFCISNFAFSHEQRVHQYIVMQAYELLKMKYPGIANTPFNLHIGGMESSCSDADQFDIPQITVGAYREDCEDPVYHYDDVIAPVRDGWRSISHFWDADAGDESKLSVWYMSGTPFNNAYQKVLRYIKPEIYGHWAAKVHFPGYPTVFYRPDGTTFDFYSRGEVGIEYDNIIDFYSNGVVRIVGYYNDLGQWVTPYMDFNLPITIRLGQSSRDRIVYEIIGRVAHLIGDMGVPAHVHNDIHGPFPIDRAESFETEMSLRYNGWDANDAENQGGVLDIYNTVPSHDYARIMRYLMYTTNQIADRFPSDQYDGDNVWHGYEGDDYSILNIISNITAPYEHSDGVFYAEAADYAFVYSIRSVAGLLYWFATETEMLPKVTVKTSFDGGSLLLNGKPVNSGYKRLFTNPTDAWLYVYDQDWTEPSGKTYNRVFEKWEKVTKNDQTTYNERRWNITITESATYTAIMNRQFNINVLPSASYIEVGSGGFVKLNGSILNAPWNGSFIQNVSSPLTLEANPPDDSWYVVGWQYDDGDLRDNLGNIRCENPLVLTPTDHLQGLHPIFKKRLASSKSTALASNGQKKLVSTNIYGPEMVYLTYESGDCIFATYSSDNCATWKDEWAIEGLPSSTLIYRNPSTVINPDNRQVSRIYEKVKYENSNWIHYIRWDGAPYFNNHYEDLGYFSSPKDYQATPVATTIKPQDREPSLLVAAWLSNGAIEYGVGKIMSDLFSFQWSAVNLSQVLTNQINNPTNIAIVVTRRLSANLSANQSTDSSGNSTNSTTVPINFNCYIVWEEPGGIKLTIGSSSSLSPVASEIDWASPKTIAANIGSETNTKPTIALDGENNIIIAWEYKNGTQGNIKVERLYGGQYINGQTFDNSTGENNYLWSATLSDYRYNPLKSNDLTITWHTSQGIAAAQYVSGNWIAPYIIDKDGQNASLEMTMSTSSSDRMVVYLNSSKVPYYNFKTKVISQPMQIGGSISTGWNLVSIPDIVGDFTKTAVYKTASSDAFAYEGSYVSKNMLTNGSGYWIKYDQTPNPDLSYVGTGLYNLPITVQSGWNMIGSISSAIQTSQISDTNHNVLSDYFKYINGGYQPDVTIEPGRGYWVKVNSVGYLTLNAASPPVNQHPPAAQEPPLPPGAPSKPRLLTPDSNTVDRSVSLTFSWYQVDGVATYRFQLSTSSTFNTLIVHDSTLTANSKSVSSLSYNTSYYWRVKATNESGSSYWSNVWKITTMSPPPVPPPAPLLSSPANNSTGQNISLYLSWNSSTGATQYRLQASRYSTFSSLVLDYTNLTGTSSWISSLSYNTKYYWRANASNSSGTSSWSTVWNFTTKSAPPPDPCPTYTSYAKMDVVVISDSLGREQTLYLRNNVLAIGKGMKSNEEMPPESPPGLFHAKFHSGKFLETIKPGKEKTILPLKIRDAVYPLTIRWDIKEENLTNHRLKIHDGQNTEDVNMSGVGQTKIEKGNNGNKTIIIESAASQPPCNPQNNKTASQGGEESTPSLPSTPTEFRLLQNTPNPFNPITEIRYDLPEELYVVLKIYDVLGQEIKTLVHEMQSAGYKTVTFDGSNLSSGVYYYRVDATSIADPNKSYSDVMKMILVK
jgi:hypothetical protein